MQQQPRWPTKKLTQSSDRHKKEKNTDTDTDKDKTQRQREKKQRQKYTTDEFTKIAYIYIN